MTPYTGPTKRVTLAEARALGPRWRIQPKIDGMMVRLYFNTRGRVERAFSRANREVPATLLEGILGAHLGRPHASLIGELEASTEAGNAAAAKRGQRLCHLFDMLHDGTRSLVREPYRLRRDALCRMNAEVQVYGQAAPWLVGVDGRAHDRTTGRYTTARLTDWRVAPIVPQAPLSALGREWERVKAEDLEGLVLVNVDAPAGARCAKLKLKVSDGIDCVAVSVSRTTVTVDWRGTLINVARGRHYVELGEVVEVRHDGFFSNGLPRFARMSRVRRDLAS